LATAASCRDDRRSEDRPELVLYCGAGIRPAAEALIRACEAGHPATVSAVYAGSGQLLGQLAAARRGDLFWPGEAFYVEKAVEAGLAEPASRRDVAYFVPVILVRKGNPLGIRGLADLAEKPIRVGLGDERAVAAGRRAVELFQKNRIPLDRVMTNVVLMAGTVGELGVAIEMNAIEAAVVWDATARQFSRAGDIVEIPADQNLPAPIPIVRLRFSTHPDLADAFIGFAASAEGQALFAAQQYTVKPPASSGPAAE
jgi:molybdate transport system substrate-binding protein